MRRAAVAVCVLVVMVCLIGLGLVNLRRISGELDTQTRRVLSTVEAGNLSSASEQLGQLETMWEHRSNAMSAIVGYIHMDPVALSLRKVKSLLELGQRDEAIVELGQLSEKFLDVWRNEKPDLDMLF